MQYNGAVLSLAARKRKPAARPNTPAARPFFMETDEKRLLRLCQQGDREAFRELVERYQRRTYAIAYNMLRNYEVSRDVAQEVFLRVFRAIKRFDLRRNFYTWLYQIAVNLCIDQLRRNAPGRALSMSEAPEPSSAQDGPVREFEKEELRHKVEGLMQQLPPKYRMVLSLRDLQGFTCEEIGQFSRTNSATVRWRLHRARKMFKELWTAQQAAGKKASQRTGEA